MGSNAGVPTLLVAQFTRCRGFCRDAVFAFQSRSGCRFSALNRKHVSKAAIFVEASIPLSLKESCEIVEALVVSRMV
jgi:hypothetical protein